MNACSCGLPSSTIRFHSVCSILTVADEARALRIAGQFTDETTYLGAHVVPADYADEGMIQYLRTERIIPPYQTRGYKLVELLRIYEVGTPSRA